MTLHKTQYIQVQQGFGDGYNRNAVQLLLDEIHREYRQHTVDWLFRGLNLEQTCDLGLDSDRSGLGQHG